MACGCGRNNNSQRRSAAVTPQATQRLINGAATPATPATQAIAPRADRSPTGLNVEKRKTQALRRDAIRKALGK
jgi:hypothetical protein